MESKPILNSAGGVDTSSQQQNAIRASGEKKASPSSSRECLKKRHVLALYSFFGFFLAYSFRANLSVAIVDMSKINAEPESPLNSSNQTSAAGYHPHGRRLKGEWSPVLQG